MAETIPPIAYGVIIFGIFAMLYVMQMFMFRASDDDFGRVLEKAGPQAKKYLEKKYRIKIEKTDAGNFQILRGRNRRIK